MHRMNRSIVERGQIAGLLGVAAPLFVLLFALIVEVGIAGYHYLILQRTIDAAAFAAGMQLDQEAFLEEGNVVQLSANACAVVADVIAADGQGVVALTGCVPAGDTVTVTGSTTAPSLFGGMLGYSGATFSWTSTAQFQTGITEAGQ
jgi:Flp pilus assembly protein TadG